MEQMSQPLSTTPPAISPSPQSPTSFAVHEQVFSLRSPHLPGNQILGGAGRTLESQSVPYCRRDGFLHGLTSTPFTEKSLAQASPLQHPAPFPPRDVLTPALLGALTTATTFTKISLHLSVFLQSVLPTEAGTLSQDLTLTPGSSREEWC